MVQGVRSGSTPRVGGPPPADEGHPLGPCGRPRGARPPENSNFSPLACRPRRRAIAACGNRGVDAVRSADHQARSGGCWARGLHRSRLGTTTTAPPSRVPSEVHARSWWRPRSRADPPPTPPHHPPGGRTPRKALYGSTGFWRQIGSSAQDDMHKDNDRLDALSRLGHAQLGRRRERLDDDNARRSGH